MYKFYFYIICCVVVGTACSNETDPTVLPPTLTLHEATGITRNEACLSGKIVLNGGRERYGIVISCMEVRRRR